MNAQENGNTHEDGRYRAVDDAIARLDYAPDALLEALNAAQESFGHLSEEALTYVARQLGVPLSQAYAVATFYEMYHLTPTGARHCLICTDPACAVAGAEAVLAAAEQHAGADGDVRVHRATCLGLCDQGPAALIDGRAYANVKADAVAALFNGGGAARAPAGDGRAARHDAPDRRARPDRPGRTPRRGRVHRPE
ncbi:MAG: NAD(P)H-dependent oxidoreductase subunit E [Anaerolineae bacterium]|nr:NAD(P)H-dependent oxidoreductase subunit E [Anaerolineae bacterium]